MFKKIFIYLIGLVISSLGIVLFIKANVGVGTGDSVAIGISKNSNLTVGMGFVCIYLSVVTMNAILSKKLPNLLFVIPVGIRGLTVDLWLIGLTNVGVENIYIRWMMLFMGIILMGIGLGMYLQTHFPKIPVDDLMITLTKLTKKSYQFNRSTFEISLLIIGFILGGPVGLGTMVIAITLGSSIEFWDKVFKKVKKNEPT